MAGEKPWSERLEAARQSRLGRLRRVPRAWLAGAAAVAIAATVSVVVFASLGRPRARPTAPDAAARRGRVLVESGELRSASVMPVYVRVEGEIAWLIEEGAIVEPGDVVARIDSTGLESRLEQQERDHEPRVTEVERAGQDLASTRTLGPLKARCAEIRLARAEWELADFEQRPTKEELDAARIDLRVAELARRKAKDDLARATVLAERGFATDTELRDLRVKALDADVEAELAKLKLELVSLGVSQLSIEAARLGVEKANLALEEARFASEADTVIAEKALDVAKAQLSNGERRLEHLRRDVASMEVKAAVAGRVTFPEMWRWTKNSSRVEVGETVRRGHRICQIADPSRVQARIHVNEVDSLDLDAGLPARVQLTAYPGLEVAGRVARVGRSAADKNEKLGNLALQKSGKAGVGVVEVLVDVDFASAAVDGLALDPESLRGGHTVTVEIDLEPPPDARGGGAGAAGEGSGPDA